MTLWTVLDALRSTAPGLYITFFLLLGLIMGSLMTVIVTRLPWTLENEDIDPWFLWRPASHCPRCRTPILWYHNLPLLGWLRLRGRCRHCQQPIGKLYPFLEVGGGLIFAALAWVVTSSDEVVALALLAWFLLALAVLDWKHYFLPDSLTQPLLWIGLMWHALLLPEQLVDAVIGTIAGYLALRGINVAWYLCRGYDGLGRGDAKLLAALGAWLGWQALPLVCLLAALMGIVGFLACFGLKNASRQQIPFGVPLALAGWGLACWQLVNLQ